MVTHDHGIPLLADTVPKNPRCRHVLTMLHLTPHGCTCCGRSTGEPRCQDCQHSGPTSRFSGFHDTVPSSDGRPCMFCSDPSTRSFPGDDTVGICERCVR